MNTQTLSDKTMVKVLKALRPKDYDRTNYYILYVMDEGKQRIIKSEPKQRFHKVYSYHLITEKIEEVKFESWTDDNFVKHSIALYEDGKIYLQALNIFQANTKFNLFKNRNEKKEN